MSSSETSKVQTSVWRSRLELLATVLLIVVTMTIGGFALADRMRPPVDSEDLGVQPALTSVIIPVADAPVKGDKNAKVALVVFSDFACPYCARAASEVMPEIQTKYIDTGKVLLVWRHYPLPIHPSARATAEATECASQQGKFWQLHDWVFAHPKELTSGRLRNAAQSAGVEMPSFEKCLAGEASEKVTRDIDLAKQLDVTGTPTWFIGTVEPDGLVKPVRRIVGLGPVKLYAKAIDSVVQSR